MLNILWGIKWFNFIIPFGVPQNKLQILVGVDLVKSLILSEFARKHEKPFVRNTLISVPVFYVMFCLVRSFLARNQNTFSCLEMKNNILNGWMTDVVSLHRLLQDRDKSSHWSEKNRWEMFALAANVHKFLFYTRCAVVYFWYNVWEWTVKVVYLTNHEVSFLNAFTVV